MRRLICAFVVRIRQVFSWPGSYTLSDDWQPIDLSQTTRVVRFIKSRFVIFILISKIHRLPEYLRYNVSFIWKPYNAFSNAGLLSCPGFLLQLAVLWVSGLRLFSATELISYKQTFWLQTDTAWDNFKISLISDNGLLTGESYSNVKCICKV